MRESIYDKRLRLWKSRQEARGYDVSGVNTLEEADDYFNHPKKIKVPKSLQPAVEEAPVVTEAVNEAEDTPVIDEVPEVIPEPPVIEEVEAVEVIAEPAVEDKPVEKKPRKPRAKTKSGASAKRKTGTK